MMPPTNMWGEIDANLQIVDPAPDAVFGYTGSLWVQCSWQSGSLWWRKTHIETLEFVCRDGNIFWPGVTFRKVEAHLWFQLKNTLDAHNAKREALRLAEI